MNTENVNHLTVLRKYVDTQITYLKLEAVEKISRIFSTLLLVLICVILLLCALFYLSAAFIVWTETLFQSYIPGILIVSALFVLLSSLLYVYRVNCFLNPFIRMMSKIMFDSNPSNSSNIQ